MNDSPTSARVKPLYVGTQIVWYIFSTIEAILLFRFLLKIIGANASATFTEFIYNISAPLVAPFLYVVQSSSVGEGIVEWSTLLALLAYWVITWAIVRLFVIAKPISKEEARVQLRRQDAD
jgi:hypothetical protein